MASTAGVVSSKEEEEAEDSTARQHGGLLILCEMRFDGSHDLSTRYKTCPRCGLTLAAEVGVCGRCGNRFLIEGAPLPPPPPLPALSVPYQPPASLPLEPRQKVVAISLALGLGGIGAHGFYLGNRTMGWALAAMMIGGGGVSLVLFMLALAGAVPMWLTAIGLAPLITALTLPLIQAARYGAAKPEQFHQWYVVEKRWF